MKDAVGKSARQVKQMLTDLDPELAVPADRVRALSGGRWEINAVVDDECRRGLEQLKGLLSHIVHFAIGGATEPGNLRLLCFAHHRYRHERRGSPPGPSA